MDKLINISNLNTVDHLSKHSGGKFRFIAKSKHTGMGCHEAQDFEHDRLFNNPESIISGYQKGVLQAVEFQPTGADYWFKVFSRTGKRIHLIDRTILVNLTVGTINSLYYNTELYNQNQYAHVNSKTWASWAYQMNEPVEMASGPRPAAPPGPK